MTTTADEPVTPFFCSVMKSRHHFSGVLVMNIAYHIKSDRKIT